MSLLRFADTFSDFAFYELDRAGAVVNCSAAATRLLGCSPDEIIGRRAPRVEGEGTSSAAAPPLEVAEREGRCEAFGWALRNDGSRFWANEVTTPIRDASGRVTGFATVIRDVTAWRIAEQERDRIFMLSQDLVCVAGFDGYFRRVNPSFVRVLGFAEADLLGKPFADFVHPDDAAATNAETAHLASGEPTLLFQNRYRCNDGSYRWLDWKATSVAADRLIYAIARDVTSQKETELKLQEYARELERSNGDLQQFAYVASHDLQEPLRAVAGCVQMLGERNVGKLDERSVELMGHAVDGAKRLQTLINDLLAFSRVGSKGVAPEWIAPGPAVEKAIRHLQVTIAESDALVTVDPLPNVWADGVQLTQLFQNLIGNAIKFRGERRPEIHIRAERGDGEVTFSVRDNGIGIEPEYHERVFGVFQRLHSQRKYSGTGIGLAICKKIVERHGGRIWIESPPGQGTTFRFTIPGRNK